MHEPRHRSSFCGADISADCRRNLPTSSQPPTTTLIIPVYRRPVRTATSSACIRSDLPRRLDALPYLPHRSPDQTASERSKANSTSTVTPGCRKLGRSYSQINSFVVGVKSQLSSPGRVSRFHLPLSTVYCHPVGGTAAVFVRGPVVTTRS